METFSFIIRETDNFREFFEVGSVIVPTSSGDIQILPGHADLIAESDKGVCVIKHKGGEESLKLGARGLIKVKGNKVTLVL